MDDAALLRRYAEARSEDAFAELVRRHLNLVYSAALRQVGGNTHCAEDVTQSVFTALALHAQSLSRHPALTGWLYTSTHFIAAKIVRSERRRQTREQEAQTMHELLREPAGDNDWQRLRPVIDEEMQRLNERDREAVLLRFFENRRLADVGTKLGLSEDAARQRVERALQKLRVLLVRRGIASTPAALAVLLENQAVVAAPAGLAATVTGSAFAGLGAGAATATGVSMSATAIVTAAVALVAIGTTVFEFNEVSRAQRALADIGRERVAMRAQLEFQKRTYAQSEQRIADQESEISTLRAANVAAAKAIAASPTSNTTTISTGATSTAEVARLAAVEREVALRREQREKTSRSMVAVNLLDTTFNAFYRRANFAPQQIAQFKALATENANRHAEIDQLAAADGLKVTDPAMQPLYDQADADFRTKAAAAFGDSALQTLQHFKETLWIRGTTDTLSTALLYSDAPLSETQANQLVEIVWNNMLSPTGVHNTDAANFDAMAEDARAVLSPTQLAAWRKITTDWKASAKR